MCRAFASCGVYVYAAKVHCIARRQKIARSASTNKKKARSDKTRAVFFSDAMIHVLGAASQDGCRYSECCKFRQKKGREATTAGQPHPSGIKGLLASPLRFPTIGKRAATQMNKKNPVKVASKAHTGQQRIAVMWAKLPRSGNRPQAA